jgi:hypothetical protein
LRQIFKCFILEVQLFIIIIFIIHGGILSLTDSHHHHHGQNPTMVGICHGGNVLGNHDYCIVLPCILFRL